MEINGSLTAIKAAIHKPVVIMEDFNYPSINWETLETDTLGKEFLDFVNDCYLIQHVNTPTRDSNVLICFFSSEDGMVKNVHVKEHLGNRHHNIITWDISLDLTRRNISKFVRIYNKADMINEQNVT